MTISSTAAVPTTQGSRYLQQLCKHWSHKFAVDFTPEQGIVDLPGGHTTMRADDTALTVTVVSPDAETLARMREVVARHLDRFAFREAPLPFDWRDAA